MNDDDDDKLAKRHTTKMIVTYSITVNSYRDDAPS